MEMNEERPPYVMFETRAVEDRDASLKNGAYTTKDVDFALITPPGSKDCIEQIVDEWFRINDENVKRERMPASWRDKWKESYRLWKSGQEIPLDGTPVKNWGILTPAQRANLIGMNIRTVEDVAKMNDEAQRRFGMGALDLKNKAIAYLKESQGTGKLVQENAALKVQVSDLSAKVNELIEANKKLAERFDKQQKKAA